MPPSTETFGIPELLETILEHATPKDVLLWQRVSKTWHAMIQESPRLQEKLFFKVRPCKNENEQYDAAWNPFTELFFTQRAIGLAVSFIARGAFSGKANYPTASWKQMFVTSPAVTKMSAWRLHCVIGRDSTWLPIVCGSGVTIGQLAETLGIEDYSYALCMTRKRA
ncbi:hypothetical protein IMSHALPRED_010601 [Imshaugia aleurites]|uniref:F-box domain-containing protein n=1 Tax=Imshaugia aleurites TaxID=172621 RepID=A0A8H3EUG6_9LECA|nr:hypothetical protein IMSHALPRED_010601 [Imshaugia aleurites]